MVSINMRECQPNIEQNGAMPVVLFMVLFYANAKFIQTVFPVCLKIFCQRFQQVYDLFIFVHSGWPSPIGWYCVVFDEAMLYS